MGLGEVAGYCQADYATSYDLYFPERNQSVSNMKLITVFYSLLRVLGVKGRGV